MAVSVFIPAVLAIAVAAQQGPPPERFKSSVDHALVQRLLRQIDGTAVPSQGTRNLGIADGLAFERRDNFAMQNVLDRECGSGIEGGRGGGGSDMLICRNEVRAEAGLVAADARERARQSIGGVQALIQSLAPSQTPKMLVYISDYVARAAITSGGRVIGRVVRPFTVAGPPARDAGAAR